MPNLARGIAGAAGAVAESYGNIERERIKQRHEMAMARVRDKYATAARKDNQKHELHRDEQKSKYRISEYELAQGDREGKEERDYTRGLTKTDKQHAHEIEKAKIAASGRGERSARMTLTDSVWQRLKSIRPDEDPSELWLEAFKLTNEKKEQSPEAEIRESWWEVFREARDGFDPMPVADATKLANEAEAAYREKHFPDLKASRERFKKQKPTPAAPEAVKTPRQGFRRVE